MIQIRPSKSAPSSDGGDATHFVLGGDKVGIAIAEQLQSNGHRVTIVGESYGSGSLPVFAGDASAPDVLAAAGIGGASTVIVATRSDRRNLLVAQLVRAHFDVPRVIALVHDPDRSSLFDAAGHEPFCVTSVLSEAVSEAV